MEGLGMSFQEPDNLTEPAEPVDSTFSLQLLSPTDRSYKEIEIDLEHASLKVIKVEKLNNAHLCKRYLTERKLMLDQRLSLDPGFKLNEKYLYHGTSVNKAFICEEGLDSRMSKQGCFGKGIYFSDYPKKCLKYAEKGGGVDKFILLMRVILGESKVYPKGAKDKNLVREPEKEAPYKGYRFYDSVQGCPVNHQEFVVYENRRALVEYIISYQRQDKDSHTSKTKFTVLATDSIKVKDADESSSDSDSFTHNSLGQDDNDTTTDEEDYGATKLRPRIVKPIPKSLNFDEVNYEELLRQKKAEFARLTGATDDNVIDLCLLRGNLDLDEAVKLYKENGNNIVDLPLPHVPKEFEEELMKEAGRPSHPEPGTDQWAALDDEQKEAIIALFIEDFLYITGLSEEDTKYAKERLASSGNNLDLAIVAHFEDM